MSNKFYNIQWRHHANNQLQQFGRMQAKQLFTDTVIGAQGKFLKAHKIILAAASPFFFQIFYKEQLATTEINSSNKLNVHEIKGLTFEQLRWVIDFIYTGDIDFKISQIETFLSACQLLQLDINKFKFLPKESFDDDVEFLETTSHDSSMITDTNNIRDENGYFSFDESIKIEESVSTNSDVSMRESPKNELKFDMPDDGINLSFLLYDDFVNNMPVNAEVVTRKRRRSIENQIRKQPKQPDLKKMRYYQDEMDNDVETKRQLFSEITNVITLENNVSKIEVFSSPVNEMSKSPSSQKLEFMLTPLSSQSCDKGVKPSCCRQIRF